MIAQSSNISLRTDSFQKLLKYIEASNWKSALQKGCRIYNVKSFNVQKLTPDKVKELYKRINQRFYMTHRSRNGVWIQNQLRIFIWFLIIMSQLKGLSPETYSEEEWSQLSSPFEDKPVQTCKFQYKSITYQKTTIWNQEQDYLLRALIQQRNETNPNWNQISRDLFRISAQKYFKTSKQCREHWNNYLNPNVLKTQWDKRQDYLLMKHVVQKGKQWASISKLLQLRRTEHLVKNRFKSLVLAYAKQFNISKKFSQSLPVLQKIYRKIKIECQEIQQLHQEGYHQIKLQKQKQLPAHQTLFRSAFQPVSKVSSDSNSTSSFASPAIISQGGSLNFQFSGSPVFSNFMMPITMYGFQGGVYAPSIFTLDSIDNKQND